MKHVETAIDGKTKKKKKDNVETVKLSDIEHVVTNNINWKNVRPRKLAVSPFFMLQGIVTYAESFEYDEFGNKKRLDGKEIKEVNEGE